MKLTLVTLVLVAAVAASPYPWAAPQASADPSKPTKVNRTRKNPHREPTPVFKAPCNCAKPIIPMNLLSANEKCLMEHSAKLGCYIASRGGCPSPAPACGMGVINTIPFAQ